jgi:hypothetical protein
MAVIAVFIHTLGDDDASPEQEAIQVPANFHGEKHPTEYSQRVVGSVRIAGVEL